MRRILYLLLLIANITPFQTEFLFGQKTLDHEIFLEKIKSSDETVYKECIREYDIYLNKFPDDVSVFIEKCKFILYAQYDEYEDHNPNQAEFDNCSSALIEKFSDHPDVLLFQTTYLYNQELEEVFINAEKSIEEHPEKWDNANLAALYMAISDKYYFDSDYDQALIYMEKVISNDERYEYSIDYAYILLNLERKDEAKQVLTSERDTLKTAWHLTQKADLLLELEAYPEAFELYNQVAQIDSTYNNNFSLASTLEGIGEYDSARRYLVADTTIIWDKQNALKNLLNHDLKYGDATQCSITYNEFRDLGYMMDPLALYRLKLFFLHPFQPWMVRDLLGLLSLLLMMAVFIVIPYIWILPVYFIGHHWNLLSRKKPYIPQWGLKMFWFVSVGYLIAGLFGTIANPNALYATINSSYSYYDFNPTAENIGYQCLIFMTTMALFGVASMYRVNPKVLLSNLWPIAITILISIGSLLAFKMISGAYIRIGTTLFDISINDLANFSNIVLISQQEINALTSTLGNGVSLLLVGLLAPVYEEIIFRGVILDSCQRYLNFNIANILQSALFAAVHMSLFLFPIFFLFGIATGIMRKKSDGLLPGIIFHALNNILVMLVLFAT